MKTKLVLALVLVATILACGGDKPPMVPDPDTNSQADAGAE